MIDLRLGDCAAILPEYADNSMDAIVTDPPAGIAFMGKEWDTFATGKRGNHCRKTGNGNETQAPGFAKDVHWDKSREAREVFIAWMTGIAAECLRVIKPGGHALVWALPRTSHWTATAWEDAGWEVRDRIAHVFGSGFPKSLDVGKAIDKVAGAEREVVEEYDSRNRYDNGHRNSSGTYAKHITGEKTYGPMLQTAPATDDARRWDGWGTALKPAVEDWWLLRKPLDAGTVAANVLAWGTGAINVAKCRIMPEDQKPDAYACNRESAHGAMSDTSYRSLVQVLDALRGIVSELRSYSTDDKARDRDVVCLDDKKQQDVLCDGIHQRLFPNGSWCGLDLMSIQDSLGDCPSCLRSYDGLLRPIQEAAQESAPSLADALEHTCLVLSESQHNHDHQCNVHPSNLGASRLCESLCSVLSGNTVSRLSLPVKFQPAGRWPSHLIHDGSAEVRACFPVTTTWAAKESARNAGNGDGSMFGLGGINQRDASSGSASRFFYAAPFEAEDFEATRLYYCAKASRKDREEGCEGLEERDYQVAVIQSPGRESLGETLEGKQASRSRNHHPTVKPVNLCRYLCRLITPPGGTVLDPFAGSGSTGKGAVLEGFSFVGIELDESYYAIAQKRIAHAQEQMRLQTTKEQPELLVMSS